MVWLGRLKPANFKSTTVNEDPPDKTFLPQLDYHRGKPLPPRSPLILSLLGLPFIHRSGISRLNPWCLYAVITAYGYALTNILLSRLSQ
ncbi:hypothetical protein SCLCIDRAFT_1219798 [Scleroderma citrinum Foug A]|uniref:Uncharacterized protein n=1 Tax=Scleroderma citrinum Foug A TaxID=1036808 RepID=A0A0C3DKZ8_9AGAM|nr:hypothetical protein SCLCIDRAFT_1219798 [Scleroderma citrinum Foug A]